MKKNSMKKRVFAGFMATAFFVSGFAISTHAAETAVPQLVIKKVLNLPKEGVKTPAETFTFTFAADSKNGKSDKTGMPTIPNVTINYSDADNADNDTVTVGKQVIKKSQDALANVTFPDAGQYTYRVVETKGSTTDMTYSQASYLVSIFTKTNAEDKIVVDTIQIKKEKEDNGTTIENAKKVPYVPGESDPSVKDNNFLFTNNYDKKDGNSNPNGGGDGSIPDADKKGFALVKNISADTINSDEKFTFTLKAKKPVGTHSTETKFDYYVVSNGTKGEKQTVEYDKEFKVTLKHHERVVFDNILLGSTVSANETVDGGYNKSVDTKSTINGTAFNSVENLVAGVVIGDQGNGVYFVNTQQSATGLLIKNLPFVLLISISGLGIFFFFKNRRREEEE